MLLIELRGLEDVFSRWLDRGSILRSQVLYLVDAHQAIAQHAELFRAETARSVMSTLAMVRVIEHCLADLESERWPRDAAREHYQRSQTIYLLQGVAV
jgi:hypothetical protein